MFQVGDKVVHPMHGAGVIDSIVREKISGKAMDFYVFKMPISGLTLKIPTENSTAIGIRAIKTRSEIEEVIARIPKLGVDMTANWNHRYRENMDRLKSGDLDERRHQGADASRQHARTIQRRAQDAAHCQADPRIRDRPGRRRGVSRG
jgi:RNA polymerase-interacting CarD/CdnL/TRCF family regulator